jgi:hypothetical protein
MMKQIWNTHTHTHKQYSLINLVIPGLYFKLTLYFLLNYIILTDIFKIKLIPKLVGYFFPDLLINKYIYIFFYFNFYKFIYR